LAASDDGRAVDRAPDVNLHRIERTQTIALPIAKAFEFFAIPRNLERLTPGFVHFRFLAPPPERISPGTVLEYRLRLYGLPIKWRTRIVSVHEPGGFVDVQDRGPYAHWQHTHTFSEIAPGRTEVGDRVEFAMPYGAFGELAYDLVVARSLEQIFDYRAAALERLFGAPQ
jgi:ligand-binding SRPBCC domain-containing protein